MRRTPLLLLVAVAGVAAQFGGWAQFATLSTCETATIENQFFSYSGPTSTCFPATTGGSIQRVCNMTGSPNAIDVRTFSSNNCQGTPDSVEKEPIGCTTTTYAQVTMAMSTVCLMQEEMVDNTQYIVEKLYTQPGCATANYWRSTFIKIGVCGLYDDSTFKKYTFNATGSYTTTCSDAQCSVDCTVALDEAAGCSSFTGETVSQSIQVSVGMNYMSTTPGASTGDYSGMSATATMATSTTGNSTTTGAGARLTPLAAVWTLLCAVAAVLA